MTDTTNHDAAYRASTFFDDDAIDAFAMSEDRDPWLMAMIRKWYIARSDKYRTVIEDAIAGERTWT